MWRVNRGWDEWGCVCAVLQLLLSLVVIYFVVDTIFYPFLCEFSWCIVSYSCLYLDDFITILKCTFLFSFWKPLPQVALAGRFFYQCSKFCWYIYLFDFEAALILMCFVIKWDVLCTDITLCLQPTVSLIHKKNRIMPQYQGWKNPRIVKSLYYS